ncbi:hypothetical protein JCM10207_004557 [Rhodosporidiobolus poonsookiae]
MPSSLRDEPLLVQIPPTTSPVLAPSHRSSTSHRQRNSADSFTLSNYKNQDIPDEDELEFLPAGVWDGEQAYPDDEDDEREGNLSDNDSLDEDDDIEDWSLEDGHVPGIPSSNARLDPKIFTCHVFQHQVLQLLRRDLGIPGWAALPDNTPSSLVQVTKVSGALTNAVFFISIPETEVDIESAMPYDHDDHPSSSNHGTPLVSSSARLFPATVLGELERGRQAAATPTPGTPTDSAPATPLTHSQPLPEPKTTIPGALPPDEDDSSPSPSPSRRSSASRPAPQKRTERTLLSAPTILLRVYGPQSGSLISRRNELHILHTLSSKYNIGAHVLGTFANGRVEEYFHSRALTKEEMREPRLSRWIGRRMRELHGVELEQMVLPPLDEDEERRRRSRSRSGGPSSDRGDSLERRPGIDPLGGGNGSSGNRSPHSGASVYSTSSSSSVFSFGTCSSSYSGYSNSSFASTSTIGSGSGASIFGTPTSLVSSPDLLPRREASESSATSKRRRGKGSSRSRRSHRGKEKDKLCVWENITRWTREAKLVLKELDELAQIPGFEKLLAARSSASTPAGPSSPPPGTADTPPATPADADQAHTNSLSHPSLTFHMRSTLNLPLFEHQLRQYRAFTHRAERATPVARSKRIFAHNDTQYGNLLLVTPHTQDPREEEEIERQAKREGGAHRRLIVVDFEYAGKNPRGFDIANHFCEWQADYHHPSLSHSLSAHQPYPSRAEQARFLRAYVGCDGGYDGSSTADSADGSGSGREDPRVERLLDEVRIWQPSSHAMWAVWGIVQAKEDLMARIAVWRERAARIAAGANYAPGSPTSASPPPSVPLEGLASEIKALQLSEEQVDEMIGLEELEDVGEVFDYLSYAAERMGMFRRELKALGVIE